MQILVSRIGKGYRVSLGQSSDSEPGMDKAEAHRPVLLFMKSVGIEVRVVECSLARNGVDPSLASTSSSLLKLLAYISPSLGKIQPDWVIYPVNGK